MKRYRKKILLGLLLGFAVIAVTLLLSDVNELLAQAVTFPWLLMIPVLALRVANWVLRFFKWHFYLHIVGVKNIRPLDSMAVFTSGFVLALSPGKVAEALKSLILKRLTGAPVAATLPVVAAERLSDGIAVLLLLAISIGSLAADEFWPIVAISLVLFALGIALLQRRALCLALLEQSARLPLLSRIAGPLRAFYESSYEIVRWRSLLIAVSIGTAANFLDGLGVYLILTGLGLPATPETFFQALLIISLSVVVGSVSALPGGLGAADLSIGVTMSTVAGLSAAEAGFATLLARFVQLWWGVMVGAVIGVIFRDRLLPADDEEAEAEAASDYAAESLTAR